MKDWKINKHETSSIHLDAMFAWKLWQKGKTDAEQCKHEEEKINELKQIFHRFIDIILHLAQQNIAFRGDKEIIGEKSCGNFLATVQLLAKYDPILKLHLEKPSKLKYMSPLIQNELITLVSEEILINIRQKIKEAEYFSIIADTTTDISHIEQLSIIIRYLKCAGEKKYEIMESFVGFISISDPTASGIEEMILHHLENKLQLDLSKCRGQGYDGAAVMSGVYNGVSKKILQKQPLAVYIHCAAHCLNLVLCDAASTSTETSIFLGILQKIFVFLTASNKRWGKFKECNLKINVKRVCVTRWESRIEAVKAVRQSYNAILKCFEDIQDDQLHKNKREELAEASSLINFIQKFNFILF